MDLKSAHCLQEADTHRHFSKRERFTDRFLLEGVHRGEPETMNFSSSVWPIKYYLIIVDDSSFDYMEYGRAYILQNLILM